MFVAGYIHRHNGFYVFKEGIEYNLVLSVVVVAVSMIGPGKYSLDHAFGLKPARRQRVDRLRHLGRARPAGPDRAAGDLLPTRRPKHPS